MTEPRLSFVIPARNEEALIGEVLAAILASVASAAGFSRSELWLPESGFEVVAFTGLGTGVGGGDREESARAMVDELRAHRGAKPVTIYLVDTDDGMLMAFEEALRNAQQGV